MREFFAWGTHKDYSNIYSETRNVLIAKSSKIGNVFNPHKSFPGRQLNAASRKSLEIQASSPPPPLSQNEEPFSNQKFVYVKISRYCNTSWK